MPTFKSLNDLMRYVNKATSDSMPEVGKELEEVFKEAIDKEVYKAYSPEIYERTGQLKDMVETTRIGNENVEVSITHTGDHISYIKGTRFYVPYGLEGGHTWGRGATNIEGEAMDIAKDKIPEKYKSEMRNKGIPIK